MTFPIRIQTRVTAIEEAREISEKKDGKIYLYAVGEGGYVIDNLQREYSNEKLIFTFKNGMPV